MNINEYAGDYESYQNKITIENAEHYLRNKREYEEAIEKLEYIISDVKDIVFGDESYGSDEERIKDLKEVLKNE